jgi:hypothetical protein
MARLNLHGVQVFAQLLALDEGCSPILVVAAGVQADVLLQQQCAGDGGDRPLK